MCVPLLESGRFGILEAFPSLPYLAHHPDGEPLDVKSLTSVHLLEVEAHMAVPKAVSQGDEVAVKQSDVTLFGCHTAPFHEAGAKLVVQHQAAKISIADLEQRCRA